MVVSIMKSYDRLGGGNCKLAYRNTATITIDFVNDFDFDGFYCLVENLKVAKSILLTKSKISYFSVLASIFYCILFFFVTLLCLELVFKCSHYAGIEIIDSTKIKECLLLFKFEQLLFKLFADF